MSSETVTVQEQQVGDLKVRVVVDPDPSSPREFDNLGTMVCWHRRYNLGDKHGFKEPRDFEEWRRGKDLVVLPLYLYDHSGLTMSTEPFSCPWDSGQVGYVYVERAKVLEDFNRKRMTDALRRKAEKQLRAEVETYDEFLRGDVYGFVVEDATGEHVDSCWGFYGGADYCLSEGVSAAKAAAKQPA